MSSQMLNLFVHKLGVVMPQSSGTSESCQKTGWLSSRSRSQSSSEHACLYCVFWTADPFSMSPNLMIKQPSLVKRCWAHGQGHREGPKTWKVQKNAIYSNRNTVCKVWGHPLNQATKWHLNNSEMVKNNDKWDKKLNHISVFGWVVLFSCPVFGRLFHREGSKLTVCQSSASCTAAVLFATRPGVLVCCYW